MNDGEQVWFSKLKKLFAAPSIFQVILGVANPVLSKSTVNAIQVLETNMEEWGKAVYSHFAKDQLPEYLGWTRNYSPVGNEILKNE